MVLEIASQIHQYSGDSEPKTGQPAPAADAEAQPAEAVTLPHERSTLQPASPTPQPAPASIPKNSPPKSEASSCLSWVVYIRDCIHTAFRFVIDLLCCKFGTTTGAAHSTSSIDVKSPPLDLVSTVERMGSIFWPYELPRLLEIFCSLPEEFVTPVRQAFKDIDPKKFHNDESIINEIRGPDSGHLCELYWVFVDQYEQKQMFEEMRYFCKGQLTGNPQTNRIRLSEAPRWLRRNLLGTDWSPKDLNSCPKEKMEKSYLQNRFEIWCSRVNNDPWADVIQYGIVFAQYKQREENHGPQPTVPDALLGTRFKDVFVS